MKNNLQTIVVTGANGQLGNELKAIAPQFAGYRFLFVTKEELAIENADTVKNYFSSNTPRSGLTVLLTPQLIKQRQKRTRRF